MPTPTSRPTATSADRLAYSARTRTGAAHNVRNAELQAARRAGTPQVSDRPRSMAIARQTAADFNRDPVRRASDAAHAGARLTLVSSGTPDRRQDLIFSQEFACWILDGGAITPGAAYHCLRGADEIIITRD